MCESVLAPYCTSPVYTCVYHLSKQFWMTGLGCLFAENTMEQVVVCVLAIATCGIENHHCYRTFIIPSQCCISPSFSASVEPRDG